MKIKQDRLEWINKNPEAKEWIAKNYLSGLPTESTILGYLFSQNDDKYNKIKQCWRTHSHRRNRKSISCELTVETYKALKKIQHKRTMTETLEEIIKINYETQKHYKNIFEQRIIELKQNREKTVSREINRLSKTLDTESSNHQEIEKLNEIVKKQDVQIHTLRSIVSIISAELTKSGITIKKDTLALIHKSLDTLLEKSEQNQTASHD